MYGNRLARRLTTRIMTLLFGVLVMMSFAAGCGGRTTNANDPAQRAAEHAAAGVSAGFHEWRA